ncbi:MAG: hypothetical protein KBT76_14680 [Sulfitobacter litoralis]|nr:hypothetical protein [Sulfitobacter litoralis]
MALITTSDKGAMVYGGNPMNALLRGGGIVWKYIPFNPADLFLSGEVGAWYAYDEAGGLWRNTDATSPVSAFGQSVAFALDRASGAGIDGGVITSLGSELITSLNSGFSPLSEPVPVGSYLRTVITTSNSTAGRVRFSLRGADNSAVSSEDQINSNGTFTLIKGATTGVATQARILYDFGFDGDFSVTTKLVPGSHASQASSSFMPQYQLAGTTYDGLDDRMATTLNPATEGTILARFSGDLASRVVMGSQAASDGRCFLALDASGRLAAGIGGQSTSTIFGGSDIRGETHTGAVTWDGSTVKLYLDAVEVYSAAQSGAVNTTIPIMHGALNANGTAAAFFDGAISDALVIDRVMTPQEITQTTNLWSA